VAHDHHSNCLVLNVVEKMIRKARKIRAPKSASGMESKWAPRDSRNYLVQFRLELICKGLRNTAVVLKYLRDVGRDEAVIAQFHC
jgi:hypothetical protein